MRKSRRPKFAVGYKPPFVLSIHGIRTHASWQKTFGESLASKGFQHFKAVDYGDYRLLRFLRESSNEKMVDEFSERYGHLVKEQAARVDLDDFNMRPSIVAHSFGTYIVGYAMLKYPDIRFDKLILCGSILPNDFDWGTLLVRDQVDRVRNEYGSLDFWAKIVRHIVRKTGDSGYAGFDYPSSSIVQERFDFTHSDFFRSTHMEKHWIPFLQQKPSPLIIRHGREVDTLQAYRAFLRQVRDLDDSCFGSIPEYQQVRLPEGNSEEWIEINDDIYTFLMDRTSNKMIGYVNAMPVTDELFEFIKCGKIPDTSTQPSDVEPYIGKEDLKVFLLSIATDASFRGKGLMNRAVETLINGLIDKLIFYAIHRQIRVAELVACAWTPAGLKLCQSLGMYRVSADRFGHPIYWLNVLEQLQKSDSRLSFIMRRLAAAYSSSAIRSRL